MGTRRGVNGAPVRPHAPPCALNGRCLGWLAEFALVAGEAGPGPAGGDQCPHPVTLSWSLVVLSAASLGRSTVCLPGASRQPRPGRAPPHLSNRWNPSAVLDAG